MKIIYTKSVTKDVRKIKDKKLISKIEKTVYEIKKATNLTDIKSLKKLISHKSAYRIRIGDYRLGFFYNEETEEVILSRFLKRNDIYKIFP